MADQEYAKWEPRAITLEDADGENKRTGRNLDDVVRDLVHQILEENEWTQELLAEKLGLKQSKISRRQSVGGYLLEELSRICILKDIDPVALFSTHPEYEGKYTGKVKFPKDHLYSKYNTLLRNAEAHDLLSALSEARSLGVFDQAVRQVKTIVNAARRAVQKDRVAGRKTLRRKKRPTSKTARERASKK